jgi:hypothetical protein
MLRMPKVSQRFGDHCNVIFRINLSVGFWKSGSELWVGGEDLIT